MCGIAGWIGREGEQVPAESVRAMAASLAAAGLPAASTPPAAETLLARLDRLGSRGRGRAALHVGCGDGVVTQVLAERYVEHGELSPLDVLYRRRDVEPPGSAGRSSRHSLGTARITTTSSPYA